MDQTALIAIIALVIADAIIWLIGWNIAIRRANPTSMAIWKALTVAIAFSPGIAAAGHGCMPVPAIVGFFVHLNPQGTIPAIWNGSSLVLMFSFSFVFFRSRPKAPVQRAPRPPRDRDLEN